jgi:hypothetical protein
MELSITSGRYSACTPRAILATESSAEYDELFAAFMEDIKPRNVVERAYAADVFHITWEIIRYRRIKTTFLNDSFQEVLAEILESEIDAETTSEARTKARAAARQWFASEAGRAETNAMLAAFGLNESSVEVRVIEATAEMIGAIDRTLAMLELRRIGAIRFIAEYRRGFADQAEQVTTWLIENAGPKLGAKEITEQT